MIEQFINWKPNSKTLDVLNKIQGVLNSFRGQGYRLTLRQLYYQLVARDYIPNSIQSYKRIGDIVNKGRLAGLLDWDMIEDRVRIPSIRSHWDSPKDFVQSVAAAYYKDHWVGQEYYIEVWCEKDAVSNIIEPVCRKWDVAFMANRGYSSQSAMYSAYYRYQEAHFEDKKLVLIYLGDHDPSGLDMTRDVQDRMNLFLSFRDLVFEENVNIDVDRIALEMQQINLYKPPENPAKQTDSRYRDYARVYGDKSWELDALEPKVLSDLVEDTIKKYVDETMWQAVAEEVADAKDEIRDAAELIL